MQSNPYCVTSIMHQETNSDPFRLAGCLNPCPLTTELQPTQPPSYAYRESTRGENEVGHEYLIPQAIREQFVSWPDELRDLPDGTILKVTGARQWRVLSTLSGWTDVLTLSWTDHGKKYNCEINYHRFHVNYVNGEYHSIEQYLEPHSL